MRSWLLDPDCNDQYSVIHGGGEKVDIFLNTSTEPILLKERSVSILFWLFLTTSSKKRLTNRFHFCLRLYCSRSQMTVTFCSSHAMASSVIYYSTEAQKNEIYLFYIIIKLAKIMQRPAK